MFESDLPESGIKFQAFAATAALAIFIFQGEKIRFVNPAAEKLTGFTADELLQKSFSNIVHPKYRKSARRSSLGKQPGESDITHLELIILAKSGDERWIDITLNRIDYLGKPSRIATVFDITERKRAEQLQDAVYSIAQAADKSKNLDDLYQAVHATISKVMNAENFYIALYDDEKKLLSFPYFVDEIDTAPPPGKPGKGLTEYILRTGDSLLVDLPTHEDLQKRGEIELVGVPSPIWLGVPLVIDNQVIGVMVVQHYSNPLIYGEREKRILEFVSSQVAMVINQKRSEDALRESSERFRGLFESVTIGLYRTTPDGIIHMANPTLVQMLGYKSFEELSQRNLEINTFYRDFPRQQALEIIEREGEIKGLESAWQRSDGSTMYVRENAKAIRDADGHSLYYEGSIEDITERKMAEEAVRRRADEFAALYETTRDLAVQKDLSTLLNTLADRVTKLIGSPGCTIYLYDKERNDLEAVVSRGTQSVGVRLRMGEGIAGQVAQALQPMVVDDHRSWKHRSSKFTDTPATAVAEVPMLYSGQLVGVLTVHELDSGDGSPPRKYTQADVDLLTLFAGSAASAVHNARLFEEISQRLLELEVLYQGSLASVQIHSLNAVAQRVVETLEQLMNWKRSSIWVLDDDFQKPDLLALSRAGLSGKAFEEQVLKLGSLLTARNQGIVGWVCAHGQTVRTGDVTSHPYYLQASESVKSELCVPLMIGNKVIGCINTESTEPDAFSEHDERLLTTLANQAAIAIDKARLYQDTLRSAERLSILYHASQQIARAGQDLEQVYASVHQAVTQLMPADAFVITLVDAIKQEIQGVYLVDHNERRPNNTFPFGEGISSRVITSGKSLRIQDFNKSNNGIKPYIFARKGMTLSVLAVPMRSGEKIMGMISVQHYAPDMYTKEDEVLLEMLAAHAGIAIENARLFEEALGRASRQVALNTIISAAASSGTELDTFLDISLNQTLQALGLEMGALWLAPSPRGEARLAVNGMSQLVGQTMAMGVALDRADLLRTSMVSEWTNETHPFAQTALGNGIHASLTVPLLSGERRIGGLSIADAFPRKWAIDEITLVEAVGREVGASVERARLFIETRSRLAELETVNRVSVASRLAHSLEEMLPALIDETMAALDADAGSIWLFDPEAGKLCQAIGRGWNTQLANLELAPGDGIPGFVLKSGDVYFSKDIHLDPIIWLSGTEILPSGWSGLCVPIRAEQETIGSFFISTPQPLEFVPEDARLLATLCEIAGNAIHRMRLYLQTELHAAELEVRVTERTAELQNALLKAREADRLKSEFIANVNHELRTPLTNLVLYNQMLRAQPTVRTEERLDVIARELSRLRKLIEDLLSLSRLDLDQAAFHPEPSNLNTLIKTLVDDRRSLAEKRDLQLDAILAPDLPEIRVDEPLMIQVISNLLTNAMNYSPAGGRVILSTFAGTTTHSQQIGFSVQDDGAGIEAEELTHIFERFYRGKAAHTSGAPGTGLGLAIVKQVIERHKGQVEVENVRDGHGARFTVWLPVNPV